MDDRYNNLPASEWSLGFPRSTPEQRALDLALKLLSTKTLVAGLDVIERETGLVLCLTAGRVDFAGVSTTAQIAVIEAWADARWSELRRYALSRHDVV